MYLDKLCGEVNLAFDVGEGEVGVGRVEGGGEGDRSPKEHHGEDGHLPHLGHRVQQPLQVNHSPLHKLTNMYTRQAHVKSR